MCGIGSVLKPKAEASRLDGEENVVEDAVDRIEERRDKSAAEEKEDEEGEHAHAVVKLSDLVRQEVAEDMAAVERRKRDEVEDEEQQVDEDDQIEEERNGKERGQALGGDAGNVLSDGDGSCDRYVTCRQHVFDDNQQDQSD